MFSRSLVLKYIRQPYKKSFFHRGLLALEAWRQRRILSGLPKERLDDIGVSEGDALREVQKPIWNVPQHWLQ